MNRRGSLILGVVILLTGIGGLAVTRWWHNRPPYGPEILNAQASLRLVDQTTADAAMHPATTVVATDPGDQIFLGRVSWSRPPHPRKGNVFRIVLLDKRNRYKAGYLAVHSPRPDDVGSGSDNSLDLAQERYPWLDGAGMRKIDGQYWSTGSAILVSSVDAAPVTFQTVLKVPVPGTSPRVATAPAAPEDLLVALISVGPDGQVYWAQRLLN